MSLKLKIILQIIISLILSITLANFSFGVVSKLGAKNSLFGVFKINIVDNNIFFDNNLMPKIALFAYEEKEGITKEPSKGTYCYKILESNKTIIELEEDKYTKYFQLQITSNSPTEDLRKCFDEFLLTIEKRYQGMINQIEENFLSSVIKDQKMEEIFNENYNYLKEEKNSKFNELVLFEKYKTLLKKDIRSVDFYNHLKSLKLNAPFELIRVNLSKQTFSKTTYSIIVFIIIFFFIFIISNRNLFQIGSILENLKKIIGIKNS